MDNRVGSKGLVPLLSSHTTQHTVPYWAIPYVSSIDAWMLFSVIQPTMLLLPIFGFRPIFWQGAS